MKDYINVQLKRKSDHPSVKDCLKVLIGGMTLGGLVLIPCLLLGL